VGAGLAVEGLFLLLCGIVDAVSGSSSAPALLAVGLVVTVAGMTVARRWPFPAQPVRSSMLPAIAVLLANAVVVSSLAYVASDAQMSVRDSIFESLSGFTTSALTTVQPEALSPGILLWRSATQWLGGYLILVMITSIAPFYSSSRRSGAHVGSDGGVAPMADRSRTGVEHVSAIYGACTLVILAAYLAAGMPVFDSVNHAMTTVSTGGFSVRNQNMAAYLSPRIEWVACAGMLMGGTSAVVFWWASLRRIGPIWRSSELKLYLFLIAAATATVVGTDGLALHEGELRRATFGVVSAASTTGFVVQRLGSWSEVAQAVSLAMMSVGAMAASAGGGFRVKRLLALISVARRELFVAVHPRAVRVVRIDDLVLTEGAVSRMLGYQSLYILFAGLGALLLSLQGYGMVEAFSAAVSALSTVGPALGPLADATAPPEPGVRWTLGVLMTLGHVEIFPVMTLLGLMGTRLRGRVGRRALVAKNATPGADKRRLGRLFRGGHGT